MPLAKKISIAFTKALDEISEAADLVDAVYAALPPDVRKRWEKGRKGRGFTDQAGQYGIGGADWKAKAIWDNRHLIDIDAAIKNVIANKIEDDLYGAAYQARDRVTGRGKYRGNTKQYREKGAKFTRKGMPK